MSLGSEFLTPINTKTAGFQFLSDNASSADGSSVAVWVDTFSPTDHDIRAQRFNAFGAKVGPDFVVSSSSLDEATPKVAMNANGDFVVTWMQTLTSGDTNVVARKFNALGIAQGNVVQVGVGTFKEHNPDVAMDDFGRFVVAYVRDTNNNNPDVFAKRYDTNGNLLNVVNVATSTRAELNPTIAMTSDGRFNVAWEEAFSATDHDIKMNRYSASAQFVSSVSIATSSLTESLPSLSMDRFGNSVVAYEKVGNGGHDIKARRVNFAGIAGLETGIASSFADERAPSVALKRNGGGFVVSYQSMSLLPTHVKVAEVSALNQVLATHDAGPRFDAAVSINGLDDYLLTYTSFESGDLNIRGRRGHLS